MEFVSLSPEKKPGYAAASRRGRGEGAEADGTETKKNNRIFAIGAFFRYCKKARESVFIYSYTVVVVVVVAERNASSSIEYIRWK